MALPKPQYPSYIPKTFVDEQSKETSRLAMNLFAKYHPSAVQQRAFNALVKDQQFLAKAELDQRRMLSEERNRLMQDLSKFREVGLGPSGRAGRTGAGAGSGQYTRGQLMDDMAAWGKTQTDRQIAQAKLGVDAGSGLISKYSPTSAQGQLIRQVVRDIKDVTSLDGLVARC